MKEKKEDCKQALVIATGQRELFSTNVCKNRDGIQTLRFLSCFIEEVLVCRANFYSSDEFLFFFFVKHVYFLSL